MVYKRLGTQSLIVNCKKHEICSLLGFYAAYYGCPHRRFGTTYRYHLQGLTLADETDGLPRSFGRKLPILRCREPQNKVDLIYIAAKAWNHTENM